MDTLAAGFWGAFFGTAALMLAAAFAAFGRSLQRVALAAALSAVMSALFAVAYLGGLPVDDRGVEYRLLAHVAVGASVTLSLMLLSLLGLLRPTERTRRWAWALPGAGALALAAGWLAAPAASLVLGSSLALAIGLAMLVVTLRRAVRGDRQAWAAVLGVLFMLAAVAGLSWIALHRDAPWWIHAVSAVAGMAYLSVMAFALWTRYSYLLELSEVMAHGPEYDPVTRMRSHGDTSQMVGSVFFSPGERGKVVGVIAVCIANLYALENLHGRAAFNHALFICASRLRRCVPPDVEMGRLGDDGFLLLVREVRDLQRLARLARQIRERLMRPVSLSTSRKVADLDAGGTDWVAEAGVGVLAAGGRLRPSQAVATARDMARTAWTYPSRLAWYDQAAGEIAEMPA
ncbi:MAG: diguanylate cyclase [Pseudomonadota bacterium]